MRDFKVDFMVVGAARSGTTSLYHYLKGHPGIFLPEVKEPNFFSNVTSVNDSDYEIPEPGISYHMKVIRSEEVYKELFQSAEPDQLKGDVSPSYLSNASTARRIYEHNPDAKIIMTLRNPVRRAFSHYLMNVASGYDKNESFDLALQAETLQAWSGGNDYLGWSSYADKVRSYFDVFPREHIMLLIFEEWVSDPAKTIEQVFEFLEVDRTFSPDFEQKHNEKIAYKNLKALNFLRKPGIKKVVEKMMPKGTRDKLKESLFQTDNMQIDLDAELETKLLEHFRPDVEALESITGKSLTGIWNLN